MVITLNIKLFCCKNHKSSHWRCSVRERVLKTSRATLLKRDYSTGAFEVLRTSIFQNICERLFLQDITEKTLHLFLSQSYQDFMIITITLEALKFLLSFCPVIVFDNLFCENIFPFLLC